MISILVIIIFFYVIINIQYLCYLEAFMFSVLNEVKERQDFLKDMEALGEAKKYQAIIQQEIAAKIRQMKAINNNKCEELGF